MTVPIPGCLGITEEDVREALKLIVALGPELPSFFRDLARVLEGRLRP